MQTLDIDRPGMPDLQFVLLVTALCTSRLTSLNVPDDVRTALFDRCWMLIHESPPPDEREKRVIDLRPWSETTLDAMVETIRTVLTNAGIQTLSWDHSPSEPTWTSTPEALPLIQRLEQLYPLPSETPAHRPVTKVGSVTDTVPSLREGNASMNSEQAHLQQLIGEMSALMTAFSPALQRHAATLESGGRDAELIDKLLKGAGVMRDSGYMYLTWARHYVALSDENLQAAEETDETNFGPS
ncbi:MAG: hypothetical protein Q7U39_00625 [Nitrospira sp.]|nr:hypothetical protein [Nitrospira sp.]